MFFKILNDLIRPNSLVPTLLIFGTSPYMTDLDALSPTINQCSIVIRKAMEKFRKSHASRQANDVLNIRNSPSISLIYNLSLNSPVLVFCEGNGD